MESILNELMGAESIQQVRDILSRNGQELAGEEVDRIWQEIDKHRVDYSREMSPDEFESVAGGSRDHTAEGCAATCEMTSWCWSNDYCVLFSVIYSNWPERTGGHKLKRFWR